MAVRAGRVACFVEAIRSAAVERRVIGGMVAVLSAEGGPLETASIVLLVGAAIAFLLMSSLDRILRLLHVPLFMLLLAEREADPGLPWVTIAILDVGHWSGQDASIEALFKLGLLATFLWSVLTLFRYGVPAGLAGLTTRPGWARCLVAATLGVGISIIAEEVASFAPVALRLLEEAVEVMVAGALAMSVVLAARVPAR